MISIRVLTLAAIFWKYASGNPVMCDLDNSKCLTESANKIYQEFVTGAIEGVPSSDPLRVDLFEGELPTMQYTLKDSTLSGMKNCVPEFIAINTKETKFKYHFACKHLIMEGKYDIKGELAGRSIEGSGDYKVDFYGYAFLFSGEYERFNSDDGKLHIVVKQYKLDIAAREKVVYDFKNLFNGDEEKSAAIHKFANENWKEVDEIVRGPTMEKFMSIFMDNGNAYMKAVPVEHVFARRE
ncbi:protein takeout-like [Anticarsia gemmatalis]|uniref:protein takeout-like n=1 Tax=Anticarsia gemmatalis TaxID=129554 RepID=UPI003F76D4D4